MSTLAELTVKAAADSGTLNEHGQPLGYVGSLTKEQEECLRTTWDGLLAFFDDNQPRLNELGLADAFVDIKLRKEEDAPASSDPNGPTAPPLSKGKSNISKNEDTPKKRAFWGGLSSTISAATGRSRASSDASESSTTADKRVTRKELRQAFWDLIMVDHPDGIVLRFLRARKWVVSRALAMAVNMLQWRIQEDVTSIIREGESKLNERMLNIGQSYFHGEDKKQRPICVINARYHSKELQPFEDVKRFTIWTMETARLMLSLPEGRADILFDLADFTMANMDYNFIKFIIQCFQDYYPESLGVYMVANPPWIFTGIWKIVKPWLDPVVAEKFFLARNTADLQVHVDPSWLSVALEGKDTYEYRYIPADTEADHARLHDTEGREVRQAALTKLHERFTTETRDWIQKESENDHSASSLRDATAVEMRTAYLQLDPYIRSRTFYHRLGVLTEDGICDWSRLIPSDEQQKAKAATPNTNSEATDTAAVSTLESVHTTTITASKEADVVTTSIKTEEVADITIETSVTTEEVAIVTTETFVKTEEVVNAITETSVTSETTDDAAATTETSAV